MIPVSRAGAEGRSESTAATVRLEPLQMDAAAITRALALVVAFVVGHVVLWKGTVVLVSVAIGVGVLLVRALHLSHDDCGLFLGGASGAATVYALMQGSRWQ